MNTTQAISGGLVCLLIAAVVGGCAPYSNNTKTDVTGHIAQIDLNANENPATGETKEVFSNDLQEKYAEAEVMNELSPDANRVIAVVDGEQILAKDYLAGVKEAGFSTGYLTAVVAEDGLTNTKFNIEWLRIRNNYSSEEIALGAEILEAAEYAEAKNRGLAVSLEEARSSVQKNREVAAQNGFHLPEPYQELIDELGEDVYWNEIAAGAAQKDDSISALKQSVIDQEAAAGEQNILWTNLRILLVENAEVKIFDQDLIGDISVEKAKEYINRYVSLPR